MKICLCSSFRNSSAYIDRYTDQVIALHKALKRSRHELSVVWGEGDSTDDTRTLLEAAYRAVAISGMGEGAIVDCTHGGKEFGSVVNEKRFKQLAYVCNKIWKAIPADSDAVVFVESDLIWDAATMTALIKRLKEYPAVVPMVLLDREGFSDQAFYDVYAYRINGEHFTQAPPYHPHYTPEKPFRVDSAGSCMALGGALARQLKWDVEVFPGICAQIYALGGEVFCDPKLSVVHL